MKRPHTSLWLVPGMVVFAFSCSETTIVTPSEPSPDEHASTLMRRAESCEDLDQALKDDVRARLRAAMDEGGQVDESPGEWGGGTGGAIGGTGGSSSGAGGSGGGGGSGVSDPGSFTGTNTQVPGVDEADFVKTDGARIYMVRKGQMHVISAWPAEQMSLQTSVAIEGFPFEMYISGDAGSAEQKAVVYSRVDGTGIYEQAGIEPPASGDPSDEPPWGGTGGAGGGFGGAEPGIPYGAPMLTKITVLGVAGGAPAVEHEVYFDGSYISSRRNGEEVRTVLRVERRGPDLRTYPTDADRQKAEMIVIERMLREGKSVEDLTSEELDQLVKEALGDVLVSENERAIDEMSYADWLPRIFTKSAGGMTASTVACESFYIPKPGSTQVGITHIAPLDLAALGSPNTGAAILGLADTMYENASVMLLASNAVETAPDWTSAWKTYVHAFDVTSGVMPTYVASGVVDGRIYGQFALDEADGSVRVVTTKGEQWSGGTTNHLFVLQAAGTDLNVVGDAGDLAPGETVYSARFVGDTAYIVTFRQTDPLFVIDLADPTHPTLLGELHIPGFSEYMHPLGDSHLLTVGREGDSNGWIQNLALQIFNVSDRMNPTLDHKYMFETTGASEAEQSHKALTYYAERGLLAIPFIGEHYNENTYHYGYESSLQLLSVDIQSGFTHLGSIGGEPLMTDAELDPNYTCYPPWYYGGEMGSSFRRGIFRDNVLFAVANDGVVAADVNQPAAPIGVVRLNDPNEVPTWCMEGTGGTGGWDGGTGGTGGGIGGDWGTGGDDGTAGTGGAFAGGSGGS